MRTTMLHPVITSFADMLEAVFSHRDNFPTLVMPAPFSQTMQETDLVIRTVITKRLFTIASHALYTHRAIISDHNKDHENGSHTEADCDKAFRDSGRFHRIHTAADQLMFHAVREEHPSAIGHSLLIVEGWKILTHHGTKWIHEADPLFPLDHLAMNILARLEQIFTSPQLEEFPQNRAGEVAPHEVVIGQIKDFRTRAVYGLLEELFAEGNGLPDGSAQRNFIINIYKMLLQVMWALVEDEVGGVAESNLHLNIRKGWEVVAMPKLNSGSVRVVILTP